MLELVILDVNETLFPLDPVADRMAEVGLPGQLDVWFARVLRDGIAAAAADRFAPFGELGRHHLAMLLDGHPEPIGVPGDRRLDVTDPQNDVIDPDHPHERPPRPFGCHRSTASRRRIGA